MSLMCDRCGTPNPDYVWQPAHVPTMTEKVEKLIGDFAVVGELLQQYRAELDTVARLECCS